MNKCLLIFWLFLLSFNFAAAQNRNLAKLAETENSFARLAEEKGVKEAFWEFLADDGLIFHPAAINGKEFWQSRPASAANLYWYPVFVDAASNGALGYTTGAGEFRPQGKTDSNVYYSEYLTIWRRQNNGDYKALVDVGISHDKPALTDKHWHSPQNTDDKSFGKVTLASNSINLFFDTATAKGLSAAYETFASDDVRFLREGKQPIVGKNNALDVYKNDKRAIVYGRAMTLQSAEDFAYSITTYELKSDKKTIEKGNAVQVWKFFAGKWQIVADVFAPIPVK